MKLYLQRHTSVDVPKGICYGQWDVMLTDNFPKELQTIQQQFADISFDAVYSSPLTRCRLLAERLCPKHLSIQYDDRLKEIAVGDYEGLNWDDICQKPGGKNWLEHFLTQGAPGGGESFLMLIERVRSFYEQLLENHVPSEPSTNVLVVAHAGVLTAFKHVITRRSIEEVYDLSMPYGALHVYDLQDPQAPLQLQ